MSGYKVKIINTSKNPNPARQSKGSSGFDLYADIKEDTSLMPGEIKLVPTGVYLDLPEGLEAQVRARSGLALNHGLSLVNGIGTIDSDYRGEVQVIITNLSDKTYCISPGERIAQLVFIPVIIPDVEYKTSIDDLSHTDRGSGGFGHSGKK